MKVNLFALVVLVVLGLGLGGFTATQSSKASSDNHVQIVRALQALKQKHNELNVLVLKSRYGLDTNYDRLAVVSFSIINEINAIKDTPAFNSEALKSQFEDYRKQAVLKEDVVQSFKSHNSLLKNSLQFSQYAGEQLVEGAADLDAPQARELFRSVNEALYKLVLLGDAAAENYIRENISEIKALTEQLPEQYRVLGLEYAIHLDTVLNEREQTEKYMLRVVDLPTLSALDTLQTQYLEYHAQEVQHMQLVQWLWYAYAVLVLAVLLFFVVKIGRRRYRLLEQETEQKAAAADSARNESQVLIDQLHSSETMAVAGRTLSALTSDLKKPLAAVQSSVEVIGSRVDSLQGFVQEMDELSRLYTKPKPDSKALSTLLNQLITLYQKQGINIGMSVLKAQLDQSQSHLREIENTVHEMESCNQ